MNWTHPKRLVLGQNDLESPKSFWNHRGIRQQYKMLIIVLRWRLGPGWGQHSKPNIKRWEDGWAELILTLIKSPTLTVADNGTGDLWWARHYTVIDCYTAGLGWCLSSNYDLTILLSNVITGGLQSDVVHSAPPRFIFQKDSKEISNLLFSALLCTALLCSQKDFHESLTENWMSIRGVKWQIFSVNANYIPIQIGR